MFLNIEDIINLDDDSDIEENSDPESMYDTTIEGILFNWISLPVCLSTNVNC